MITPFILMTLACVIMAITISLQWRRIKRQEKLIGDFYDLRKKVDWRKECCAQCKYHFIEHNGQKYPCSFAECSDEEALRFNYANGCQGVYEYLQTGVFPERCKK